MRDRKSFYWLLIALVFFAFVSGGCGGSKEDDKNTLKSAPAIANFLVTFDSNGGSWIQSQIIEEGSRAIKPTDPVRRNYLFLNWNTDELLTNEFDFTTPITKSLTLYAKWQFHQEKFTITFDSNGGSSVENQIVDSGNKAVQPTNPTRDGYVFQGWYFDSSLTNLFDFNSAITDNITLYAKWEAELTFTVTFDSNGGSEVSSINVESDGTIEMPEVPTKEGWIFAGWYKDAEFTQVFIFGTDGDKITSNITLYAQWLDLDALIAEYAASEIVIGYAKGDNAKHVTQNLTLPTKVNSADITWNSNSSAVSPNGTVTRQDADTDVMLTATALHNGKTSVPKTFEVKVIKKRTRVNSTITPLTLNEAKSGDITVEQNSSGDVTGIEGQYVSFDVNNADDALDAITVLRDELGIENPAEELELNGVNINEYGAKYSFGQYYNALRVYGHRVIVSTNARNQANFLDSNFISTDIIAKSNLSTTITQSQAEEIAKKDYNNNIDFSAQEVIYSFGEYKNYPIRVWIVTISGTQKDGSYADETFFIKSSDGTIISKNNNILSMTSNYGINEVNQKVQFPTTFEYSPLEFNGFNYMLDTNLNVEIFYGELPSAFNRVRLETNKLWTDRHQVSAYTNMRRVIQLWNEKFGRNSLDNNGMRVKVVTHNTCWKEDGTIVKDNAAWFPNKKIIVICDRENENYVRSPAAALDVLVHESGHAVLNYEIGDEFGTSENLSTKAINEAYADIFACIMTEDWKMAEDLFDNNPSFDCMRNISEPTSAGAISGFNHSSFNNNKGIDPRNWSKKWDSYKGTLDYNHNVLEEHIFSHYISHAAYLMYKNGLSWEELGKLWYQTLYHNVYKPETKFSDVRREVLKAAKEIPSLNSTSKIRIIENAFDEVGIYDTVTLNGKVTDFDTGKPINDAYVEITKLFDGTIAGAAVTDAKGNFSVVLGKTMYKISVSTLGYSEYITTEEIKDDTTLDVKLAKEQSDAPSNPDTPDNPVDEPDTPTPTPTPVVTDVPIDEAHFPDEIFRTYIQSNFDTDNNGILSADEIAKITEIDVRNRKNISSLIGIEYFTALTYLNCENNQLTVLDVSKNIALTSLDCSHNQLTTLDVDKNTSLMMLYCDYNRLTVLDVSKNTALTRLACGNNRLTALYFGKNTALTYLHCSNNQLTILDIGENTALTELTCPYNRLTVLDVSKNIALTWLSCSNNQLTALDVSKNTALASLSCESNQLTFLGVSKNTSLSSLWCYNNQLTVLDVSKNTALTNLSCGGNLLTVLDVSKNIALGYLGCNGNQLTTLDISRNTALTRLDCDLNQLTELDLSNCPNLNSSSVTCDEIVTVTWSDGTVTKNGEIITENTTTSSALSVSNAGSSTTANNSNALTIIASIPKFTAARTGEYVFDVPLDNEIPEDSKLILLNGSEDLNGAFISDNKNLKVSADFEAGRTYSPVIVAKSEETSGSGGGCNAGIFRIFILFPLIVLLKSVRR